LLLADSTWEANMSFTDREWESGVQWNEYLASVRAHADLWHHHFEKAEVPESIAARLSDLPGPRRVLILSEDWCGDAARSVPVIVKALAAAPNVEVRLIDIKHHEDLIDRHLSKKARAIPVAIVMDEDGTALGWWGPRPAPLQAMLRDRLRELGSPSKEEMGRFYAPIMGWYKQDAGITALQEVTLLLERGR
jgi:hypothetical protein